jgi:DNA invertase Pin-like site-specific DNA recombinase
MLRGRPYRIGQSGNRVPAPGGGGRACEREAISERTKAALAAAKARGTRLGTPQPGRRSKTMGKALKARTSQFAANILPLIREVQAGGHTSLNAIAGQLNARKVATARGGRWTHVQVGQILERAAK